MRRSSSVVSIVMPRLPWHPGFEDKFIYPSDLLSRSPIRPHHDNASKVSGPNHLHSTDICRCEFDVTALMPVSNDSIGMIWGIPGWLCGMCVCQVSRFDSLHFADLIFIYLLDLEPSTLPSMPDRSIRTLCMLDGWPG